MGRMHAPGKGIASSALPYKRTPPSWLKTSSEEVVEQICKLAKKGSTPSQIGVILRDSQGIAQVKAVTGNKILRILKSNGKRKKFLHFFFIFIFFIFIIYFYHLFLSFIFIIIYFIFFKSLYISMYVYIF